MIVVLMELAVSIGLPQIFERGGLQGLGFGEVEFVLDLLKA